ncbi:MAG: RNA polymerase-binding protein DksA [Steroidobacteraceae bacterium]
MAAKKPAVKAKKAKVPAKKAEHARKAEPLKKAGAKAAPAPRAKSPASKPRPAAAKSRAPAAASTHAPAKTQPAAKRAAKPVEAKPAAPVKPAAAPTKAAAPVNESLVPKPTNTKPAAKTATESPEASAKPAAAPAKPAPSERPPVTAKATAAPRRASEDANDATVDTEEGDGSDVTSTNLLAGPRNVKPYIPRRGEQYMNKEQLDHFRNILNTWKRDLMQEVDRTVLHMKDEAANFPDPNDRATQESEFSLELRTRDRERKLIRKIDEAMKRIDDGTYGYCNETGEEIGIKRLEARPVATLCVEAQERRERREKQYGDRDDRYR